MIIEREDFIREIEVYPQEIRYKLLKLYEESNNESKEKDLDTYSLISEIINELFNKFGFLNDPVIPFSFFQSKIGRVIIAVMSDIDNRLYTINDLIDMTKTEDRPNGLTSQYIYQEIKEGRLKASKDGSRWVISHAEVQRFLTLKGIK